MTPGITKITKTIDPATIVIKPTTPSGKEEGLARKLAPQPILPQGSVEGGKGGEGGTVAPFPFSTPSNATFLSVVFQNLAEGTVAAIASKAGDPQQGGWVAQDGCKVSELCTPDRNTYFNCASLRPHEGKVTARKEQAAAYHALVLDDVGTKVDRSKLGAFKPTWELETSPGNFQIGFRLDPPLRDEKEVERFQQRIAAAELTDNGALGMVRWARLPNGSNGKPKYLTDGMPFSCKLTVWSPAVSYTAERILDELVPASVTAPTIVDRSAAPALRPKAKRQIGIFTPSADEHPVLEAFKARGLYKRQISEGRHEVTCPWLSEHTDQLDTGAAYFEPDGQYPTGGFCCQHSHGDRYHIAQILEEFELSEREARNQALIRVTPGEMLRIQEAAEGLLAAHGDLYQAGGVLITVKEDADTGDASIIPVGESALTLLLSSISDWERFDGRKKEWVRCDPPSRNVGLLFKAQGYESLPELRGLARQPYFNATGQLVTATGYDAGSARLGLFDARKFPSPGRSKSEAEEALKLLQDLIGEFHFATDHDRAAALCAIFTAATRPSLPLAPAFHVNAPASGSGKSYLCETISLFAGPGGSSRVSYPKTSEEATKVILSLLMAGPAVIEFDDMDTDWLPHGVINRMLTSGTITERVLGVSKVATVSTSALILGSGNNVGPLRDLARRVLTINLNARSAVPGTLSYRGNPVATLKSIREKYVTAVLTIIEAWKAAGSPKAAVPSIASYGAWSDHCREPLIWLGLPDPAGVLIEQMRSDPDADTLQRFLAEWHKAHGEKALTLRQLLGDSYGCNDLREAILDLPVVEKGDINRTRFGYYLKRNQQRIVGGRMLQKAECSERNAWRVVEVATGVVEPDASPPPLPSLGGPQPVNDANTERPEDLF